MNWILSKWWVKCMIRGAERIHISIAYIRAIFSIALAYPATWEPALIFSGWQWSSRLNRPVASPTEQDLASNLRHEFCNSYRIRLRPTSSTLYFRLASMPLARRTESLYSLKRKFNSVEI
jgi:hypothetical protein